MKGKRKAESPGINPSEALAAGNRSEGTHLEE
jgi:hypothetical protein